MRGKLQSAVILAAVALCLAGCGDRSDQAESVITSSIGISKEQKAVLKAGIEPGAVLTEHCLYNDDGVDVTQMDHAGNKLNHVVLKDEETFDSLLCGSDKRIIYARNVGFGQENIDKDLYSVPVLQTDTGETVQWDQAEQIASCQYDMVDNAKIYLQEPYLIYGADDHTLVRLDLETGTEETLEFPVERVTGYNFAYMDGCLYLVDEDSGVVYRIHISEWKLETLYDCENPKEQIAAIWVDGQCLYMEIGTDEDGFVSDRLECFDMEQKKTVDQLSVQEVKHYLEKEKIYTDVREDYVFFEGLSVYAGKVYITVVVWPQSQERMGEEIMVLLSCTGNDMSNLENEREVTKWCYERREYIDWSTLDGYGDLYYFEYADQEVESHLMCYHLDTKKLEEVGHNELIWLGYDVLQGW